MRMIFYFVNLSLEDFEYGKERAYLRRQGKKVYAMDDPDYCMVEYKDDATAFNGLKKAQSEVRA